MESKAVRDMSIEEARVALLGAKLESDRLKSVLDKNLFFKLIKEMSDYLEPNEVGQTNTVCTGSIFHRYMRGLISASNTG